jgi:hypothetical protein
MVKQYQLQATNLGVIWYMMMNNDLAIDLFFKNYMIIKSSFFFCCC